MKWSHLRNNFLNTKSEIDRRACNKKRNYCVILIRKAKQTFFGNINTENVTDNETFWRTVKPFFTDKIMTRSKIPLTEKKKIKNKDKEKVMMEGVISNYSNIKPVFFANIVPNLKIIPS